MRRLLQPRLLLETALILTILAGAAMAIRSGMRFRTVEAENVRLVLQAGRLPIADPDRVNMIAVPTGEPLHWLWRVYYPAGFTPAQGVKLMSGSMSSGGGSATLTPQEFWLRIRVRETSPGKVQIYEAHSSGSSLSGLDDGTLEKEFPGWWKDVEFDQVGVDQTFTFGVDEGAIVLALRFPTRRLDEIEKKLGKDFRQRCEKGIVRCYLGKVKDDNP